MAFQSSAQEPEIQASFEGDAVRFQVSGENVEMLRAEIFNLAGERIYDSGPRAGNVLGWPMTTEAGDRVARGTYLFVIQTWNASGEQVKSRVSKLAVTPDGVGLSQALSESLKDPDNADEDSKSTDDSVKSAAVDVDHSNESWAFGKVGIGTISPKAVLDVSNQVGAIVHMGRTAWIGPAKPREAEGRYVSSGRVAGIEILERGLTNWSSAASTKGHLWEWYSTSNTLRLWTPEIRDLLGITPSGNVGIGTTSPSAALEVNRSSANLLVLRNSSAGGASVFRVERDGDVRADRSFNCGLSSGCFNSGQGADIAERVESTERLEPGDVVAIDPNSDGKFRKSHDVISRRVAGVISTSPGVTLANELDADTNALEDSRPLLALAGRVPVKVTANVQPVRAGDLLVTSSMSGFAMKCPDESECVGAVLGKALGSLKQGTGVIMAQLMLQ